MKRLKMIWLIFKFVMSDEIIQVGTIIIINGMFCSFFTMIFGDYLCKQFYSVIFDFMYILVLPAYIWYPQTIEPEVITIH